MAVLVLDAGVPIAHERGYRALAAWLGRAARKSVDIAVTAPTITEVWRDGSRHACLARLLNVCRIVDCDRRLARAAGETLARAQSSATLGALVIAAAVVAGAAVLTDDQGPETARRGGGVRVLALRATATPLTPGAS